MRRIKGKKENFVSKANKYRRQKEKERKKEKENLMARKKE